MNGSQDRIGVLYLDDEPHNLSAFKASFRRDFDVHITSDPDEAVAILQSNDIQVVISDQRMPVITGVEFFKKILVSFPDTARILLTGYTDIAVVIDSINEGQVFRFMDKPWDEQKVYEAVVSGFQYYKTNRELRLKNMALQRAVDELDKFVYSISHDLRAPVATLRGLLNINRLEKDEEELVRQSEAAEECLLQIDRYLSGLVRNFRSKHIQAEPVAVNVASLLEEVLQVVRMNPEAKKVDIRTDSVDREIQADPYRLSLVLNSLISCAVQYKREGEVHPWVEVKLQEDPKHWIIKVKDNGNGVPSPLEEHVFNQSSRPWTSLQESGFGLFMARETTSKMGGMLTMHSNPGEGSEFSVILPR